MKILLLSLTLACLLAGPALAAGQGEKPLLEELRALAEKARRQQAADRWLQRALDDLVARYDRPWQRTLLFDDFSDGDFRRNPAWQVVEGRFEVSRAQGLVARAGDPVRAGRTTDEADARAQPDLTGALVGAILDQAFGTNKHQEDRPGDHERNAVPFASGPNRIRVKAGVSNAFAITATLRASDRPATRFEIAVLQDTRGRYGYRLRVDAGRPGQVELVRLRRGYEAIVERAKLPAALGDGHLHDLAWRQAPDGRVSVLLDDKPVFSVRDRAFRDGYPWLELRQEGGELVLRSLRVEGT